MNANYVLLCIIQKLISSLIHKEDVIKLTWQEEVICYLIYSFIEALDDRKDEPVKPIVAPTTKVITHHTIKIGRPGYTVVKQRDPATGQYGLLFEIQYPEIERGLQPRHRFMSAFEQKVQVPDKNFQYFIEYEV